jgi:hypothetical protein
MLFLFLFGKEFGSTPPATRAYAEIEKKVAMEQEFRLSIMKNISTFHHLSDEQLVGATQALEEKYFIRGDFIIQQDDIGDSVSTCMI